MARNPHLFDAAGESPAPPSFAGFEPFPFYPGYSANLLKGASARTAATPPSGALKTN
jgi:hypothetical protein